MQGDNDFLIGKQYSQGWNARIAGRSFTENPYAGGTLEYKSWIAGYEDASAIVNRPSVNGEKGKQ